MSSDRRSAQLLQAIAEAIGTDVATIVALRGRAASDTGSLPAAEHHRMVLLHRLVGAFESLSSDESRLQAVQMLEALAAHGTARSGPSS